MKIKNQHKILSLLSLAVSQFTFAGGLTSPYDFSSAQVLPKGVFSPRFKFVSTSLEKKYSSSGNTVPLAQDLNRNITWQDVLNNETDQVKRAQIQSLIQDAGGNAQTGNAGRTTGVVNTYTAVYVPALSYGLNEKISLGLGVPIFSTNIKVDTGFVKTTEGQNVINQASESGSPVSSEEAKNKLNNAMADKLSGLGYNPLRSQSTTGVGDIKVGAKYQVYKDSQQAVALAPSLTLPTGNESSVNDLIPLGTGDGQTDLGLSASYDRRLIGGLSAGVYAAYNNQLPDQIEKRIPTAKESLSADKEQVSRNLGDQYSTGANLQYFLSKIGTSIGGGYNFQYQDTTTYEGTKYSKDRYKILTSNEGSQLLHSVTGAIGFSTVEFYKKKQFIYPFETQLT
jgi:hypothetical protein